MVLSVLFREERLMCWRLFKKCHLKINFTPEFQFQGLRHDGEESLQICSNFLFPPRPYTWMRRAHIRCEKVSLKLLEIMHKISVNSDCSRLGSLKNKLYIRKKISAWDRVWTHSVGMAPSMGLTKLGVNTIYVTHWSRILEQFT